MKSNQKTTYPSPSTTWTTVGVLSVTYMFSMIDRQILVLLFDPIKADLQITDTQIGLLSGLAFALVYTTVGIPMGRAADLWVRKYVIIIGVSIWSLMTILSGFTRNFFQLFLARMGVGFGEAALTPTAYAMIGDLLPPNRLAKGMSLFVFGGMLGNVMALLVGGAVIGLVDSAGSLHLPYLGEFRSWQLVLVIVGAASMLMVIPLSLIPEPKRHGKQVNISGKDNERKKGEDMQVLSFYEVLSYIWENKNFYFPFIIGMCFAALSSYGFAAWIPTYFIREHGWSAASTGITLGVITLVSLPGVWVSGWLADRFYEKGYHDISLSITIFVLALSAPIICLVIYIPAMPLKVGILAVAIFIIMPYHVMLPTMIQMATPHHIRAQVSAIHLFVINLVGISFGPVLIALVTDQVFQDEMAVGHSIAIVGAVAYSLAACLLLFALKPFKGRILLLTAGLSENQPADNGAQTSQDMATATH